MCGAFELPLADFRDFTKHFNDLSVVSGVKDLVDEGVHIDLVPQLRPEVSQKVLHASERVEVGLKLK